MATDASTLVTPPEDAYPAMIGAIEPPPARPVRPGPYSGRSNHVSPDKLKIDRAARPDWPTGADRMPTVGEEVYCTEGLCSVVRVLGRTGNGSRLLELRLDSGDRRPFFAAASNVLVHPAID